MARMSRQALCAAFVVLLTVVVMPPARAQTQARRVAIVYELTLPPLFEPTGRAAETADFIVDTFLRDVRSLETERRDERFAFAVSGVTCDQLRLIGTTPAERAIAAVQRLARRHRLLRTPYTPVRVEHLPSDGLRREVRDGDLAVRRCAGTQPRDPFLPPDVTIPSAERLKELDEEGVRSAVSAYAVPPAEKRPRILPAVRVGDRGQADGLATARPEAPALVAVLNAGDQDLTSRITEDEAIEVVDIAKLSALDVIGGVIDPSFDVPRSYRLAIDRATDAVAHFESYTLPDNPLVPIYGTVLATARDTATWRAGSRAESRAESLEGEQRARMLAETLAKADRSVTLSEGSVTFTSRRGAVPVTISSRAKYPVRVRIELSSPKLDFSDGPATDASRLVVIEPPGDTVTFQAVARSTGTFPTDVVLRAPDGRVFDRAEVTVRSAAANLSAVVLTAGGAGFLIYWFIRRLRRGPRNAA